MLLILLSKTLLVVPRFPARFHDSNNQLVTNDAIRQSVHKYRHKSSHLIMAGVTLDRGKMLPLFLN